MTNEEAIKWLESIDKNYIHGGDEWYDEQRHEAIKTAIKALEKDKCSSCKHYDKDYEKTCLNPEGTCRVFEYDGYEEAENEINDNL